MKGKRLTAWTNGCRELTVGGVVFQHQSLWELVPPHADVYRRQAQGPLSMKELQLHLKISRHTTTVRTGEAEQYLEREHRKSYNGNISHYSPSFITLFKLKILFVCTWVLYLYHFHLSISSSKPLYMLLYSLSNSWPLLWLFLLLLVVVCVRSNLTYWFHLIFFICTCI